MPSRELSPRFIFIRERVKRSDSHLPEILKINLFQSNIQPLFLHTSARSTSGNALQQRFRIDHLKIRGTN
jgi:hypothetical protein